MQSLAAEHESPSVAPALFRGQQITHFNMTTTIHVIASDWPAKVREMNSNLMRASRSKFYLYKREVAILLEHTVERDRLLAGVIPANSIAMSNGGVLANWKVNDVGEWLDIAVHKGYISLSRASLLKLLADSPVRRFVFCTHHDTGCVAVESVDHAGIGRPLRLSGPRTHTEDDHGTGCLHSAAIAAALASNKDLETALRSAREEVARGLRNAVRHGRHRGSVLAV